MYSVIKESYTLNTFISHGHFTGIADYVCQHRIIMPACVNAQLCIIIEIHSS